MLFYLMIILDHNNTTCTDCYNHPTLSFKETMRINTQKGGEKKCAQIGETPWPGEISTEKEMRFTLSRSIRRDPSPDPLFYILVCSARRCLFAA